MESASLQGRGLLRPPRLPACATSIVLLPEPENCSPGGILNIHLIYCPLPQDDPRQRQPDLAKAKAVLNWEPKVALEDGLKETIAYFKHSLEIA